MAERVNIYFVTAVRSGLDGLNINSELFRDCNAMITECPTVNFSFPAIPIESRIRPPVVNLGQCQPFGKSPKGIDKPKITFKQ